MARAAFTTGLKNIFNNMLIPCPLNIEDTDPKKCHPEKLLS